MRLALIVAALTLVPVAQASGDAQKLYVYGDSFAIGTEPFLPVALIGWQIESDAEVNRRTASVAPALRAKGSDLAPFVHLSVGTGDDPTRPGRFRRRVRKIMRIVGADRCVVWPDMARPQLRPNGRGYNAWRPLNEVLRDEAGRRDKLIVPRWRRLLRAHPEWISPIDGTHVDASGYQARAELIADGVRECADRLQATAG